MGKLLLLIVLALGLGLTFPESRAVILEHSAPLLDPAYAWMTNQELAQIVEDLEVHQESRGGLPAGRGEFDEWMEERYPQVGSREDGWGSHYRLEVTGESFRVISAGPSGEFGTDDDLSLQGARDPRSRR